MRPLRKVRVVAIDPGSRCWPLAHSAAQRRNRGMQGEPTVDLTRVLSHYDLGELRSQSRDLRGTINTSFVIELLKRGQRTQYFLRRYRQGIVEEEIEFEHALIQHTSRKGLCPIANVHPTRQGQTYLRLAQEVAVPPVAYFAVFGFPPGEDRYTWVGPRCTKPELHNVGLSLPASMAVRERLPAAWSPD